MSSPSTKPPKITTSPATPVKGHRTRGSIASPIQPAVTSSTGRKWSTSVTPQHTAPLDFDPPHLMPRATASGSHSSRSAVSADPFSHPQIFIGGILASIVLSGITYSMIYDTALDTSVASLLPDRTAYLAKKSNVLNQWFVKLSWAWTTLAFVSHLVSSPPSALSRRTRLLSFVLGTAAWIGFSGWFFGASLNHRLIAYSGGQCAINLPRRWGVPGDMLRRISEGDRDPVVWGEWVMVPVPRMFCETSKRITRKSLPALFDVLETVGVPDIGALTRRKGGKASSGGVYGNARYHAGFDISGHMFLLTLASLLLARELAPTWRRWFGSSSAAHPRRKDGAGIGSVGRGGTVNHLAAVFGTALIGLWAFMLGATAVYFHNPQEKLAGLGEYCFTRDDGRVVVYIMIDAAFHGSSDVCGKSTDDSAGTRRRGDYPLFSLDRHRRVCRPGDPHWTRLFTARRAQGE